MRVLQFGDRVRLARLLSCSGLHSFILTLDNDTLVAVRAGFSSGYSGEGPRTLSFVLRLLRAHGADIEEYEVDGKFIARVDQGALTLDDLEYLDNAEPVRPPRWRGYILRDPLLLLRPEDMGELWASFPYVVPFAVIDSRIADLALRLFENPDEALLTGYRRLETIVRRRTGLDEHGVKLFSQAFLGDSPRLTWDWLDEGERKGRATLFTATYMAFRNPRAHRELDTDMRYHLTEFLLLNQLYLLESEAERPDDTPNQRFNLTPA